MISTMRSLARLASAAIAITIGLSATPSRAQNFIFAYLSAGGSAGNDCTATQPCSNFTLAFNSIFSESDFGHIVCLTPFNATSPTNSSIGPTDSDTILEIDCPAGIDLQPFSWKPTTTGSTAKFRNVTFTSSDSGSPFGFSSITFQSSGTLIFENCVLENSTLSALDLEPNGPLKLVFRNSRISDNGAGILLKPAAGGSIHATLDHATIANNAGGGIRIDTTNGPVTLDVTDSVIDDNGGTGINALGNAGGQAIVSIKNSVMARNGGAGVQANGANAGVLLQTTLLDQNVLGATSVVNGGNMFTYGNNSIVGSAGSGFNRTAGLQ